MLCEDARAVHAKFLLTPLGRKLVDAANSFKKDVTLVPAATPTPFAAAEANILNPGVIMTVYGIKLHITHRWMTCSCPSYMRLHPSQFSWASYHDAHLMSTIMASLSACHFLLLYHCALPLPNILGILCSPLVFIAVLRCITPDIFCFFRSMLWLEWDPCFFLVNVAQ